ncbi:hypothetical protein BD414DRAFT_513707 [Trametes punicea]|nr:hypothetical protein BD414DRAFT_513707 [Trametes punicea]
MPEGHIPAACTHVVPYPSQHAAAPIPIPSDCGKSASTLPENATYESYGATLQGSEDNPYHPFRSRLDWEIARWAKLRGSGSTAFSDLLAIEGVAENLALSFKNSRELNKIIDGGLPPSRPRFQRHEIIVAGESFEVYFRDILECIRSLYGDPEFAPLLLLEPEKHFTDEEEKTRVYFDMNTGKWWWDALEWDRPGATVIPTQLTQFGSKSAYPDIRCKPSRRGQILLAYLPTSCLMHIKNKAARRRTLANLFHACMTRVTQPLVAASRDGITLMSGDRVARRGHPILAIYVGDYPEQTGDCPKCPTDKASMGNDTNISRPFRPLADVLDALATIEEGPRAYTTACRKVGIKPLYHPFWETLPYTNIFYAITPDLLHQLYQGVMKHLVAWIKKAFGDEELDARVRRLPQNNSLRHFSKGISKLTRVTGKEHRDMCRILLGLIIGLPLPHGLSPSRLVRATRALLDFLYYAQFSCQTTDTLSQLNEALKSFHANKAIFHFHFPKLHSLDHYPRSIELFGSTDNYDTQYTERLHIDFTKDAYRASNKKDELSQMTIERHGKYIAWRLEHDKTAQWADLDMKPRIQMARHPSVKSVTFADIAAKYGATHFRDTLARFVVQQNHPNLAAHEVEQRSAGVYFGFNSVSAFHKIKFNIPDVQGLGLQTSDPRDVVHVRPARKNKYHNTVPGRFDTALIQEQDRSAGDDSASSEAGEDFRVVQVRMVFKLPEKGAAALFPSLSPSDRQQHFAYVHWFTPFASHPDSPDHGLYKISHAVHDRGSRIGSIIPIENIERSCHLFPDFGPVANRAWTSSNVLEQCKDFYLNTFADLSTYQLFY